MPDVNGEATALLALWNDVAPAVEADYNDWHAHEHVPERCTVPGILWGVRYARHAGGAMPKYLTLYGLRDPDVLDSEPYQRLLRDPTPTSRRMRPALHNVSRWVCRLEGPTAAPQALHLAVWTVAGDEAPAHPGSGRAAGVPGALRARRSMDARPLPWLAAAQDHGVAGDWLLCVELDRPALARTWTDAQLYTRLPVGRSRAWRPPAGS